MRNLIERYVYDVTRRLPEKQREEVKKELMANINDMLGEKPTDAEIETVLLNLGHPRKLANNYRESQRYLIGPEWMDDYLMVMKIVLVIAGILGMLGGLISSLTNPEAVTTIGLIAEVFAKTLSSIFDSLLGAFATVTLIFVAIEYSNKKRSDDFSLRSLPDLPKANVKELKRSKIITGIIFEIIFGVFFIYILVTEQFNLIWFDDDFNVISQIAIFQQSIVNNFIPLFILSVALTVAADIYRLMKLTWNSTTYLAYGVAKIFSAIVSVAFITTAGLFTTELITKLADMFTVLDTQMGEWLYGAMKIVAILTLLGLTTDLLTTWFKKVRPNK